MPSENVATPRLPRPCPVCNQIFEPHKVGGVWTKTCGEKACRNEMTARGQRGRKHAYKQRSEHVTLTCEVCAKQWTLAPSQVKNRRTCSRACAALLKRTEGPNTRRGKNNPNFKHGLRAGDRDRNGERRWYAAMKPYCEHPDCKGGNYPLALHHCITRQELRKAGGDIWDPRNALTLCASCHASHHHRTRPVPLSALPDCAFVFAVEVLGSDRAFNYLGRVCSGSDARLDALLVEEAA